MQLKGGSLQQKKGWWYLVKATGGKRKWIPLHTRDADEAQRLAKQSEPARAAEDGEEQYLRALIAQGEAARIKLLALTHAHDADAIAWPDLFGRWTAAANDLTPHAGTRETYHLQISALIKWAGDHAVPSPARMGATQAQAYVDARALTVTTAGRDVALFKRVWRDLHLGDAWMGVKADPAGRCETNYRRLSIDEVRRLVEVARGGHRRKKVGPHGWFEKGYYNAVPDVADLIALGYHTGLRRNDCARLTAENVDGDFLRIVPEKTAGKKPRPLLIPLQPEARQIVKRLLEGGGKRLFPRLYDASLSKSLRQTFERAKVTDNTFGKASFHSLRATYISMMDEAGVPPHVTDAITGHAKQGMHGRYTQPGREALMAAVVKAIPPLGL